MEQIVNHDPKAIVGYVETCGKHTTILCMLCTTASQPLSPYTAAGFPKLVTGYRQGVYYTYSAILNEDGPKKCVSCGRKLVAYTWGDYETTP